MDSQVSASSQTEPVEPLTWTSDRHEREKYLALQQLLGSTFPGCPRLMFRVENDPLTRPILYFDAIKEAKELLTSGKTFSLIKESHPETVLELSPLGDLGKASPVTYRRKHSVSPGRLPFPTPNGMPA